MRTAASLLAVTFAGLCVSASPAFAQQASGSTVTDSKVLEGVTSQALSLRGCNVVNGQAVQGAVINIFGCNRTAQLSHIVVHATLSDLRPNPVVSPNFKSIDRTFDAYKASLEAICADISRELSKAVPLKRKGNLTLELGLNSDNQLQIADFNKQPATIHFTRLKNFRTLEDLQQQMNTPEQVSVDTIVADAGDPEDVDLMTHFRAGVYRVIVAAPGYRESDDFIELNDHGSIRTLSGTVQFPWKIILKPGATPTIAVYPVSVQSGVPSVPKFAVLGDRATSLMLKDLQSDRLTVFSVTPHMRVGYDTGRSKGEQANPPIYHADLQIHTSFELTQ